MYLRKERTIYIVAGITDMRKQINGLSALAQDKQPEKIFSGSYFVFLGKTRKVMKILYWDKSGFCMWGFLKNLLFNLSSRFQQLHWHKL